jgi:hypothetical protein
MSADVSALGPRKQPTSRSLMGQFSNPIVRDEIAALYSATRTS